MCFWMLLISFDMFIFKMQPYESERMFLLRPVRSGQNVIKLKRHIVPLAARFLLNNVLLHTVVAMIKWHAVTEETLGEGTMLPHPVHSCQICMTSILPTLKPRLPCLTPISYNLFKAVGKAVVCKIANIGFSDRFGTSQSRATATTLCQIHQHPTL